MRAFKLLIFLVFSVMLLLGAAASYGKEKLGSPEKGKILYDKLRCYYCHKIGGVGGTTGPDLTKEGTKNRGIQWQIRNLNDATSTHPTKHPDPRMPKFDRLTDKMFLDLAAYLESLK